MASKKSQSNTSGEFAVIKTGGKQYKVSVGDIVTIEKLAGTFTLGDKIVFDQVLLVDTGADTIVGMPTIAGKTVEASFQSVGRAAKVVVMRYKQKSRYLKKNGHRQPFTRVKITAIK